MTFKRQIESVEDCVCPDVDDGPLHFWTVDGPWSLSCDNCGADAVIVQTTLPEEGW